MSVGSNKKTASMQGNNGKISFSPDESELEQDLLDSEEKIKLPSMQSGVGLSELNLQNDHTRSRS
jgi:hypothetical protein